MYWVEFQAGRADPIPWYFEYFQAADRCNTQPWVLIGGEQDQTKNMDFWRLAALVVAAAEADHVQWIRDHPPKKSPGTPGTI